MSNQIVPIDQVVYGVAETFAQVAVDKSIDFKREAEFAIQILYASDYLRGIAASNPQSVRDAVTNIAAIGITLNPARKLAYLVPRKGAVCLDLSYLGLTELAVASGSILWVKSELVYETEQAGFRLNGFDKPPTHPHDPFAKNRGEVVGVYVVAKTRDGDYLTDTMTIEEVYAIRDRSEAWKAWISKKKSCPWVTDPGEMIKKTIVKRSSKMWPKTNRLDQAIHYLNTDGGQGIDFNEAPSSAPQKMQEAPDFSIGNILARLDAAESLDEVALVRREGLTAASRTKDKVAYDRINSAVARKREQMKSGGVQDVAHREVMK